MKRKQTRSQIDDAHKDPFAYTEQWRTLLDSNDPQLVEDSAAALFDKLFDRAVGYARRKGIVGTEDARDAASQAVGTIIRRASNIEQYPKSRLATLKDREELFSYLYTTIFRRCLKLKQRKKELSESDLAIHLGGSDGSHDIGTIDIIEQTSGCTPTPAEMVAHDEMLSHLVRNLKKQDRAILTLKLQGLSKVDIARAIGCSRATVHRAIDRSKRPVEAILRFNTILCRCGYNQIVLRLPFPYIAPASASRYASYS